MIAANLLQAVALLPLLAVQTRADLPLVYVVICLQAALSTVFEPAKNSLLPTLVGARHLVSANALVALNQNLGRLIGAPLGGVLLATGGLGLIVAVDAATYVVSAALIALAPRLPATGTHGPADAAAPVARGLLAVLRAPALRGAFLAEFVAGIAQGLFVVLFVLFVVDRLRGSDADVGLLRGVQAIGSIVAGVALGFLARRASARALAVVGCVTFGLVSLATWNLPAITTSIPPYVALFILVGAPGVLMSAGIVTTLQQGSADSERGSVFTMFGLLAALGQAIGMLSAGLLTLPLGILPLLEAQGCLYLAAGVVAAVLMPRTVSQPEHGRIGG